MLLLNSMSAFCFAGFRPVDATAGGETGVEGGGDAVRFFEDGICVAAVDWDTVLWVALRFLRCATSLSHSDKENPKRYNGEECTLAHCKSCRVGPQ